MALPESSLSSACRAIVDHVQRVFREGGHPIQARLGAPAQLAPAVSDAEHRINFFFHRFEPQGFGPDRLPDQTWWIRAHCVVTAFGVDDDQVAAGENDLRLLGEVVRIFHETPVLAPVTVGDVIVQAQVVFQPLSLDDINRLWSTQKDVVYRPSVAYEIALLPVVPRQPHADGPLVGAVGVSVQARREASANATGRRPGATFWPADIDTSREDWAPQLCFVEQRSAVQSLALRIDSPELAALQPRVLIAGAVGTPVTLRWDVWDRGQGWRPDDRAIAVTVGVARIDPSAIPDGAAIPIELPLRDTGQAALYAVRRYLRASDGAAVEVRSDPVLVTLHGDST